MELFLFLGSLFAFLFIGIPISMVLVLCSIVLMWHSGMWDSMIIPSTMLDGASHLQILTRIILPLSLPVLMVIMLYYAVGLWNSWFGAMIYLRDRAKYPLQLILREILIQNDTSSMTRNVGMEDNASVSVTVQYAVIVVATVPILVIYPFVQKFFTKGVMIGAVKG